MLSTRLTIALNSNRNTKTVLLIPGDASADPGAPNSMRAHVLKSAQTRLRLKPKKKSNATSARFFAAHTGDELLTADDWTRAITTTNTASDAFILVSAGEDFVGNRKAGKTTTTHGAASNSGNERDHGSDSGSVAVNILAHTAQVDVQSLAQLHATAASLPGITLAVGQPDLHPGSKFPVGAAFVSRGGWVHPPLIGGDIGCGMAWFRTGLTSAQVDGDRGRKVAERLRGLEGVWRGERERRAWVAGGDDSDDDDDASAGPEWDQSLGTIGAGNHFAEIQVVERAEEGAGLKEGEVVLLVHSGSRGYGGDILKRYTADGRHESLRVGDGDDGLAEQYLAEHDRACRWARANRDLIALRFLAVLEPGNERWALGSGLDPNDLDIDNADGDDQLERRVQQVRESVRERKVVDIWHNNVQRVPWPLNVDPTSTTVASPLDAVTATLSLSDKSLTGNEDEDDSDSQQASKERDAPHLQPSTEPRHEYAYIHRKGAAPTLDPATLAPLPLLPLPGSRATPTVLLAPAFSPRNAAAAANAFSLAHGAGRAMSRAKALHSLSGKYRGDTDALLRPGKVAAAAAAAAGAGKMVDERHRRRDGDGGALAGDDEEVVVGKDAEKGAGTWVVCDEKQLVWEEAPEAYKDVWAVAADLVRAGAAEVRGWCAPRVSYKVRSR